MSESTGEREITLETPDTELALHLSRELEWAERIEGWVFDPGPGLVLQRIYRLKVLSSFLDEVANFTVDLPTVQSWLRDKLGDAALADAVEAALVGKQTHAVAGAQSEAQLAVAELIRLRVRQCDEVLDAEPKSDGGEER
ncbi:MAG: hypothetical protein ACYC2X_09780 [Coriobacteriia bacterium]